MFYEGTVLLGSQHTVTGKITLLYCLLVLSVSSFFTTNICSCCLTLTWSTVVVVVVHRNRWWCSSALLPSAMGMEVAVESDLRLAGPRTVWAWEETGVARSISRHLSSFLGLLDLCATPPLECVHGVSGEGPLYVPCNHSVFHCWMLEVFFSLGVLPLLFRFVGFFFLPPA